MIQETDILIIGAGAAGLAAAIFAGEAAQGNGLRVVLVDGAKKPGAKILVSGGGRCNVTHRIVTPEDYWGGPRTLIRNILRAFDHERTIEWMRSLGVRLKLEPTGKYFPVTDEARTVLEALIRRVEELGVEFRTGVRIADVREAQDGFEAWLRDGGMFARSKRVIVATGGLSLPKSGSDGTGLGWMERLGHAIVQTTPALAPLVLEAGAEPGGRFADFAGVTLELRLAMHDPNGKQLFEHSGSAVFTHFGLSGPAPMNFSRHFSRYLIEHGGERPKVTIGHPQFGSVHEADGWLREKIRTNPKRAAASALGELFPERFARALAENYGRLVDLNREQRAELARRIAALRIHVIGDRGYSFAETTAGGVELREINPRTMESRRKSGLFICGEMLDADGRIGGFCFQWAWATGYLAGRGAVESLLK